MAYSYSTPTNGINDPATQTKTLTSTAGTPGSALPSPTTAPNLYTAVQSQPISGMPATATSGTLQGIYSGTSSPTLVGPMANESPQTQTSTAPSMTGTNPLDTRGQVFQYLPTQSPAPTTSATDPLLNRFDLANQQFNTYADQTNPAFQAAIRSATQAATTAGRLGSGMLTTDYGTLAERRAQDLQNERDALFQQAAGQSVADRLAAQGQAYNQALSSAGFTAGQNQAQLGQQNYTQQFQDQLAQQGIGNAMQQYQLQNQAQAQQAAQEQARLALLAQLGYVQPNTQPLQYQSALNGYQAAQYGNTASQLFSLLGYGNPYQAAGGYVPPAENPYFNQTPGSYYYGGQ